MEIWNKTANNTDIVGRDKCTSLTFDGTYLYAGSYASPGKLIRRYIIPSNDLHQRKISLIDEQTHSGIYSVYPFLALGTQLTSNAVAWTYGNYSEVIPVDTILNMFYITEIVVYDRTANVEYQINIASGLAGAEVSLATISSVATAAGVSNELVFPNPIKVSSTSRISARCADSTGGLTCRIKVVYKN